MGRFKFALLRTCEMTSLESSSFLPLNSEVMVYLGVAKAGHQDNRIDYVCVRDPKLKTIIRRWIRSLEGSHTSLIDAPWRFRRAVKIALSVLDLGRMPLQLYGVCRGAAAAAFAELRSYGAVCELGRWTSHKSMRPYLNEASAALTAQRFPPNAFLTTQACMKHIPWQMFK